MSASYKHLDFEGLQSYHRNLKNYIDDTLSMSDEEINNLCEQCLVDYSSGSEVDLSNVLVDETENANI